MPPTTSIAGTARLISVQQALNRRAGGEPLLGKDLRTPVYDATGAT